MFIYKWELRIEFFPIFNSLRFTITGITRILLFYNK